jgi:hypothetical protein
LYVNKVLANYLPSHDTSESVLLKPGRHGHKNPSRVSKQLVEINMQLWVPVEHSSTAWGRGDGGKKGLRGRGVGRKEERKREDNVEVGG